MFLFHARNILQTSDISISLFTCLCLLFVYHFLQVISLAVFVSICSCLGRNICAGCLLRSVIPEGPVSLLTGTPTAAGHSLGLLSLCRVGPYAEGNIADCRVHKPERWEAPF